MVEYTHAEIRSIARRFGATHGVVQRMAEAQVLDKTQALNGHNPISEGLITIGDAARKYKIPWRTLQKRVQRGQLQMYGTRPGPGGGHILVLEADIVAYITNPPKTGRPPKLPT